MNLIGGKSNMLKDYVFDCLRQFGNTFIPKKVVDKNGEEAILDELRSKGFNCTLEKRYVMDFNPSGVAHPNNRRGAKKDVIYLIEEVRDCDKPSLVVG